MSDKKDKNKIVIEIPRPKHRAGVMPTKREKDRSKSIPREEKHKKSIDPE